MFHDDTALKLGRFEFGIIKKKARQMIGRSGYREQDREEIEQELTARLLKSLESFNPRLGHRKAFVTAVVERDVANMLRDARAAKRDHRRISSLHVTIETTDDGPTELAESIGEREYNARRCQRPRSNEEQAQMASDLADARATLAPNEQVVFDLLKSHSIAAIARMLGVPRTTLNDTVRRMRCRFEHTGLRDYL